MRDLANRFLPPAAVLFFGIILLFFGGSTIRQAKNFPETQAVVTYAEKEIIYGDDNTYREKMTAYVQYTVDGKTYNEILNNASKSLSYGDEITVKYDPDDPSYVTALTKGSGVIALVLGIITTTGGLAFLAYKVVRGR